MKKPTVFNVYMKFKKKIHICKAGNVKIFLYEKKEKKSSDKVWTFGKASVASSTFSKRRDI